KAPAKLGFKRARKRRKKDLEQCGQMNLFAANKGRVLHLPSRLSLFEQALRLDERGESNAADFYQKAISAGDCLADAYCNLGILESKAGKIQKAFDFFTQSLKQDPRHPESHYNLANLYFDLENLNLAQHHYEIAAEIDAHFPNIFFNLGLVLAMREDFDAALTALSKYRELAPDEDGVKADDLLTSLKRSLAAQRGLRNEKLS
ncbi:MAG: tetratricopeptide repeat protein, partial [bacterium]